MTSRLALGLLLAAGVSTTAHAGLISGNYTLDNGNAVALQGLEWMPLTYTAGLSRTDVENGFTDRFGTTWVAGEWKYASREQTETLLGSLWDQSYNGWSSGNGIGAQWFIRTFGGLGTWKNSDGTTSETFSQSGWTQYDNSLFLFGNTGECNSRTTSSCFGEIRYAQNFAQNISTINVSTNRREVAYVADSGLVGYFDEAYGLKAGTDPHNVVLNVDLTLEVLGSLLVRKAAATPPPAVSAPTSLSVVAIGLLSLLLRRRRPSHQ